jgi:hypothetical protein
VVEDLGCCLVQIEGAELCFHALTRPNIGIVCLNATAEQVRGEDEESEATKPSASVRAATRAKVRCLRSPLLRFSGMPGISREAGWDPARAWSDFWATPASGPILRFR